MQIGIIGLPTAGKTTIFNALTRGQAETASYSRGGQMVVHTAMVAVPDPRVAILSGMFKPRKTIYAQVQYNDIAGLAKGIGRSGGLSGPLLNQVAQNDALMIVVRAFADPEVAHPEGSVNPQRDVEILATELILNDLSVVERRIERLQAGRNKGGATPVEREAALRELALMERMRTTLENEIPLRTLELTPEERKMVSGYALLTLLPVLVVVNTGEEDALGPKLTMPHAEQLVLMALQGKLEMEIAQMGPDEASEFLKEFGIQEPGLSRAIRASYQLLGLQAFFTVGEDEVRAWTVRVGANAVEAAGTIHTDLARGFIRAEVISYQDMIDDQTMAEARKKGHLRLEGRDYLVKDGDILNIRFAL